MIEILKELAARFAGFDLQQRRFNQGWPKPYRARILVNKNENAAYRLTAYGDSLEAAVARLYGDVCKVDGR
jgi:hypothetical protein